MNLHSNLGSDPVRRLDLSFYVEVQAGSPVREVVEKMQISKRKCALIMDNGVLKGVFTGHDIRQLIGTDGLTKSIEEVMTPDPRTIDADTRVIDAIHILNEKSRRYLPVLNKDGHVVGTLTQYSVIKYVSDFFPEDIYNLPPEPDQIATSRDGA